ncbi:MAG: pentapeptide repeat-containing protein [Desulfobacterales bacterium]|nr:MAG: pentapeptide repeat-containing protein [Desulfobacterales bacterium]
MLKFFLWLLWDFSGLRFVWEKIRPPIDQTTKKRPPATFMIWTFGAFFIYIALFGLASHRYENRIGIIENRTNALITHLSTPAFKKAIERIPDIQKMKIPVKPEILMPSSVILSIFSSNIEYREMVDLLKQLIEDWKDSLQGVSLVGADLSNLDLSGAKLHKADLSGAMLLYTNLEKAWLSHAVLNHANLFHAILDQAALFHAKLNNSNLEQSLLKNAEMVNVMLKGANLKWADLKDANLHKADFEGANLEKANLEGAKLKDANFINSNLDKVRGLKADQLCEAKSLYRAKLLDPDLEKQAKEKCPHLLEKPENDNSS